MNTDPKSDDGSIARRLARLGLSLPPPIVAPGSVALPFPFVHVVGRRVFVSGHGPQAPDGSLAPLRGKLGRELDLTQAMDRVDAPDLPVRGQPGDETPSSN